MIKEETIRDPELETRSIRTGGMQQGNGVIGKGKEVIRSTGEIILREIMIKVKTMGKEIVETMRITEIGMVMKEEIEGTVKTDIATTKEGRRE